MGDGPVLIYVQKNARKIKGTEKLTNKLARGGKLWFDNA